MGLSVGHAETVARALGCAQSSKLLLINRSFSQNITILSCLFHFQVLQLANNHLKDCGFHNT